MENVQIFIDHLTVLFMNHNAANRAEILTWSAPERLSANDCVQHEPTVYISIVQDLTCESFKN